MLTWLDYSPQITSWSPQGMRALRQCKVPRAEVNFVSIQRENSLPLKKEMNKALTLLPNCQIFAVRLWITTSPCRWPVGSLPSTCMLCTPPHCTKDVYTTRGSTRDLWTVGSEVHETHSAYKFALSRKLTVLGLIVKERHTLKGSELSSGIYCRVKWLSTDVSEVTNRRENLKSHTF
jgi:hypothetical protein